METNEDYFNAWIQFKSAELEKNISISIFKSRDDLGIGLGLESPTIYIPDSEIIVDSWEGLDFGPDGGISLNYCECVLYEQDHDTYSELLVESLALADFGQNKIILYFDPFSVVDHLSLEPALRSVLDKIADLAGWHKDNRIEIDKERLDVKDPCLEKVYFAYKSSLRKEEEKIVRHLNDNRYRLKLLQQEIEKKEKELWNIEENKNKDITKNPEVISYYDLLKSNGISVEVCGDIIKCVMPPFKINGTELGPLMIQYQTTNKSISVLRTYDTPRENIAITGHWHPHVDTGGKICFGTAGTAINGIISKPFTNPFEVLVFVTDFLMNGYYREGSYKWIEFWDRADGWMCETCDDFHEDNESCPYICRMCDADTSDGNHVICEIHDTCFDLPEYCVQCKNQLLSLLESSANISDLESALDKNEDLPESLVINNDNKRFFYLIKGKDPCDNPHSRVVFSSNEWTGITSFRCIEFALARWKVHAIYEKNTNENYSLKLVRGSSSSLYDMDEWNVPISIESSEDIKDSAVIAIFNKDKEFYASEYITNIYNVGTDHRAVCYSVDFFYCAIHRAHEEKRPEAIYYPSGKEFTLRSFNMGAGNSGINITNKMIEDFGLKERFEKGLGIDPEFVIAALGIKHKPPKEKRIPKTRNTKTWRIVKKIIALNFDKQFHLINSIGQNRLPTEGEVLRSINSNNIYNLQTQELKDSFEKFMEASSTRRVNYIAKFFDEKGI